jgi:hypothetical protein
MKRKNAGSVLTIFRHRFAVRSEHRLARDGISLDHADRTLDRAYPPLDR